MARSFPGAALSCYKPGDENHRHIASSGGGQQPKIKVSQPPKAEGSFLSRSWGPRRPSACDPRPLPPLSFKVPVVGFRVISSDDDSKPNDICKDRVSKEGLIQFAGVGMWTYFRGHHGWRQGMGSRVEQGRERDSLGRERRGEGVSKVHSHQPV